MALSGSFSTNKYTTSNHGTIGLILSWTATQSIANNTSTISWTLKSNGTMSSGYYVQAGPVTVRIAGNVVLNITSRFNMYGGGGFKRTGSITLSHTEKGLRNAAMSIQAAIYSSSVNCKASKTFELDKIDRYGIINNIDAFTDEEYPSVLYSNPAGTDMVQDLKIRITWNNGAGATNYVNLDDNGGTYTFTSSTFTDANKASIYAAYPNTKNVVLTFDLQSTMDGTDYHFYKDVTMSIVNAEPVSNGMDYLDVSPATAITLNPQIIVQEQSTLRIKVFPFTAKKSATIELSRYRLDFNGERYGLMQESGADYYYCDIGTPSYSGTYTAVITVEDSRGNKSTDSMDIPITAWTKPTAECTAVRVNGFESNTDITVDATISSIIDESVPVERNTMYIKEKHREKNGSWSDEYTMSDNTPYRVSLDNTKEYEIEIAVYDSFTANDKSIYTLTVAKGIPAFSIGRNMNAVGVNGYPEKDGQLFVGEGGEAKIDGVVYPNTYSSTEHKVGYWIDGSAIYEKTISYSSTIASGGNVTIPSNLWSQKGQPVDLILYSTSGTSKIAWRFVAAQINASGELQLFNGRAAKLTFDTFTIQYIKL